RIRHSRPQFYKVPVGFLTIGRAGRPRDSATKLAGDGETAGTLLCDFSVIQLLGARNDICSDLVIRCSAPCQPRSRRGWMGAMEIGWRGAMPWTTIQHLAQL